MRLPALGVTTALAALAVGFASVGSGADATAVRPIVRFLDLGGGPVRGGPSGLGAPITIYGTGFGDKRGRVTIGGHEVARYLLWGGHAANVRLQTIVVQPGPNVGGGSVVVTAGGRSSRGKARFKATHGRIFTVAPAGSDSALCTEREPCATLSHVIHDRMRGGDVMLVRGGVYAESEIWIRGSAGERGTAARPLSIKAYPLERPVFENADRPLIVDSDNVTIAGLEFHGGKSLGIPETGLPGHHGDRLIDNVVKGTVGFAAFDVHGDGHLLAGNVCDVAGSSVGTQGHCYYVSYGDGDTLLNNVAQGATGYGIHVFDQQRSTTDFRRRISHLLIDGNVMRRSRLRSGLILAMGDEGSLGNQINAVTVRNNIFEANSHAGIVISSNVHDVTITGNTFDQNGREGVSIADDPTISQIRIAGNTITQSTNTTCTVECSGFPVAHVAIGKRARNVRVVRNHYGPGRANVVRTG